MEHSFHPHPVMAAVKIFIYLAALTALLFLARDFLGDLLVQLLAFGWLAGIASVIIAFTIAKFQTVTLGPNTITYSRGVLATKKVILPYARITETSYAQGPLERILGVGTISIDTAGGSDIAIRVGNVRYSDIRRLLQEVGEKTGKEGGS